jgi:hypothetical protein
VFAGAAREAVFSKPEVIRKVNADFIPVALKAALVNNPPPNEEGRLYGEIGRSKPAPQGICVVNSAGKVLDWALMFDSDKSVLDFLDHASKRFAEYPDARKPLAAERYMKYPSNKLDDVEDSGKVVPLPDHHAAGKHCPGTPPLRRATILARLFGRALDKDGKPMKDTIRQEHYVEDRFHVPVETQEVLAQALLENKRLRLGDDLARLLVSHAYLGQIDVQPCVCMVKDRAENRGEWKRCEFWAQKAEAGKETALWRIEGESEAVSELAITSHGIHNVKLTWEGFIEMKGNRMTRLLIAARGNEKLQSSKDDHPLKKEKGDAVAFLPGGHPIDLECQVRYGIIGEPIADEAPASEAVTEDPPVEVPDEARRHVVEALGTPFILFREKVQMELKLMDEQLKKVDERMTKTVQETQQFFQKLQETDEDKRPQEMHEYRQRAHEKLAEFVKKTLKEDQRKRLRQIELQHDGLFALGRQDVQDELKTSDQQKNKFMDLVHEMEKKIQPLIQDAQNKGTPDEIRPKVMKIRKEHKGKIEALLTDAQKKQWKEMLGKPLDLDD